MPLRSKFGGRSLVIEVCRSGMLDFVVYSRPGYQIPLGSREAQWHRDLEERLDFELGEQK